MAVTAGLHPSEDPRQMPQLSADGRWAVMLHEVEGEEQWCVLECITAPSGEERWETAAWVSAMGQDTQIMLYRCADGIYDSDDRHTRPYRAWA